jgi:hypothetical protein
MTAWLLSLVLSGCGPEVVTGTHRAITLEPGERRLFHVPDLGTVTGSTGRCVEETLDSSENDTLALEASCAGVRTTLVWTKSGKRLHIMACAEADDRTSALVTFRKSIQAQLKSLKSVTACVRNGRVELWGWVNDANELKRLGALEKKHGLERVRSYVELVESES